MPYFTVIIPTHNRHQLTRRAIDSVLRQTDTDYELILVDDGSTDETPTLADDYADRLHYLRQENAGVSAARNRGIAAAQSPYIAFLDSDDEWLPRMLEKQRAYIDAHPDCRIHQTDEIWIRRGTRVNQKLVHRKKEGNIFIDSLALCLISPSSVVMDRGLFDTYGSFDELLPACEDYDLWLRITAFERVGLLDERLLVKYGGHEDQLSGRYWGMDRFRVYAILRFLGRYGSSCDPVYAERARETALAKCRILLAGARKRGKSAFARELENLIERMTDNDPQRIDCDWLLGDGTEQAQ